MALFIHVSLPRKLIGYLKSVVEKMHFINSLVDVPVATHPCPIIEHFFNLIQPPFRAGVDGFLIDHWQKCLHRLILERAGVAQNHIHAFSFSDLPFHIQLSLLRWLLIRPPTETSGKPIKLIHSVGAANNQVADSLDIKNIAIPRKKQLGIFLFVPDQSAPPRLSMIGQNGIGSSLVVSVYTKNRGSFQGQRALAYRSVQVMKRYPTIDPVQTGKNIRSLRLQRNLSVRDVQTFLGLDHPQAIYLWQKGKNLPSVDNLCALSVLFGVPIEDILVFGPSNNE